MSKLIVKTCDCCGETKEVYASHSNGKKFFTCCRKCKHIMVGKNNKEVWNNLSDEEKEERIRKTMESRTNPGKGLTDYWKDHNTKMLEHTINMIKDHKGMVKVQERTKLKISQSPCVLLKAHAIVMKDDPERLTTEFCQKIMGIKSDYDKNTTDL